MGREIALAELADREGDACQRTGRNERRDFRERLAGARFGGEARRWNVRRLYTDAWPFER